MASRLRISTTGPVPAAGAAGRVLGLLQATGAPLW
jgi:hypothetical protein